MTGKDGNTPKHPDYQDLCTLFNQKFSFVTISPERVFTFEGTHYTETTQLSVKAWVDKTVGHVGHLREHHCVEFLKKILRSGQLSTAEELELFKHSIRGKLNCRNGIVDMKTGQLLPHSSATGFKYVLPYDFEPDQVSEMFLDWLAHVMQDRVELIEAVLDVMAYCLCPDYDDHVFAYFVGEGRNGKSTLLHIIEELVGKANYSAISLSQLAHNRFAPANLEGKLVNLSDESSGVDLSVEALNSIKGLSAGADLEVERKGVQGFTLKNTAKLIFAANKTPRFHEQGTAIRSRLLAIPFDQRFEKPDARVEEALIKEVPRICSMLVTRIRENLASNGGKFKVSRGGQAGLQAQEKVLLAGSSVHEWSKECIESSVQIPEAQYISCKEAYVHYTQWCQVNNYKPVNSVSFGHQMLHGGVSGVVSGSVVKTIGGKSIRIYPHTKWKEESL